MGGARAPTTSLQMAGCQRRPCFVVVVARRLKKNARSWTIFSRDLLAGNPTDSNDHSISQESVNWLRTVWPLSERGWVYHATQAPSFLVGGTCDAVLRRMLRRGSGLDDC